MTGDDSLNFIEPRVAAGASFFDEHNRILMVVPTYKDYWDIPGGYVEHGEFPHAAVRREVLEELNIKPTIGRPLVADWWSDSPENSGKAKVCSFLTAENWKAPLSTRSRSTVSKFKESSCVGPTR